MGRLWWKSLFTAALSRRACRNGQRLKPRDRWATTVEDHIGFHFCQPRPGIWGYRFTETEQLQIEKMSKFPVFLKSSVFEMTTDATLIMSELAAHFSLSLSLLLPFHPVLTEHCTFMKPAAVRSEMTPSISVIWSEGKRFYQPEQKASQQVWLGVTSLSSPLCFNLPLCRRPF